ncbi:DJ-1/PfpI family protein [Paludibaculum fermentans]|uniref:DJ-1/PfpI family protein n=1 Tax=Paludibaculum fermentans TaxID=1473598 RepID=UPI003EBEBB7D
MPSIRHIALLCGIAGILSAQPAKTDAPRKVAFLIAPGAVMIDFTGPWEVFQDVDMAGSTMDNRKGAFELFTVAESASPIRVSGGMQIVPDYTFQNAPQPDIIVVPALHTSKPMLQWLRTASRKAELTMSVCAGAFAMAEAGLLEGKPATIHHMFFDGFAARFPKVELKRGVRFVDAGQVASAAGLTSGIDLALHVVERFHGRDVAAKTADMLEHESLSWQNPEQTMDARWLRAGTPSGGQVDVVCGMNIPAETKITLSHRGKTYHFCSEQCKRSFSESPGQFVK